MAQLAGAFKISQTAVATATTTAVVLPNKTTILAGVVFDNSVNFTSFVDSEGNSFTQIGSEISAGVGNHKARFYICENARGGGAYQATLNVSGSATLGIFGIALNGLRRNCLDQSSGVQDSSSPFTGTAIAPTRERVLLVSFFAGDSASNPATHSESTGFSIIAAAEEKDGSSFWTACLATRSVSALGSYNSSFTESGGAQSIVFMVSLFDGDDPRPAKLDLAKQADWKPQRWDLPIYPELLLDDFLPSAGGGSSDNIVGAPTDQPDQAAGAMVLAVAISGAPKDQADQASGSMAVAVAVTGAPRDQADQSAGSMAVAVAITGADQDQPDQVAASGGTPGTNIDAAAQDQPDQVASSAALAIAASGALKDQADTMSASAALAVAVTSALQDEKDRAAGAVALMVGITGAPQDQPDQSAGAAVLAISITTDAKDLADMVAAFGGAPAAVVDSAIRDQPDQAAGSTAVAVAVSGSLQDQIDRIAAAVVSPHSITAGVIDLGDRVVSTVLIASSATAALRDADWQLLADKALAVAMSFTGRDSADILQASSVLIVMETAGGFVAELLLADRVFSFNIEARRFELSLADRSFNLSADARIFPLVKP